MVSRPAGRRRASRNLDRIFAAVGPVADHRHAHQHVAEAEQCDREPWGRPANPDDQWIYVEVTHLNRSAAEEALALD